MFRQSDPGKNGPAGQTADTASRQHPEPLVGVTSIAKNRRGRESKYPYWWRGHLPIRDGGQRCGTPTYRGHGAEQNQPPNQVSQGEGAPRQLGIDFAMDHGRRGCRGSSAGDSEPPQNDTPVGCWHLSNSGGGSFQNPPTRPFGCVHNIAHLGLPRQGAGSQGGRSDGCFGQCFAPVGAGAIRRDSAE